MRKGDYQIPFDEAGNQRDYPYFIEHENVWRENFDFDDTLTLKSYGRGRSSVTFTMSRASGETVSVFVSDFFDMAASSNFCAGKITGRFTFTKKGKNYGCKLTEEQPNG